jgi:hypothetical protein
MPEDKHKDLDFIVDQLDWAKNVDEHFKANNYLEPIVHSGGVGQGHVDKWIVYGHVDGKQLFSARELTVEPGGSVTIKDEGASGLIVVQGSGTVGKLDVDSPNYIRFGWRSPGRELPMTQVWAQGRRLRLSTCPRGWRNCRTRLCRWPSSRRRRRSTPSRRRLVRPPSGRRWLSHRGRGSYRRHPSRPMTRS